MLHSRLVYPSVNEGQGRDGSRPSQPHQRAGRSDWEGVGGGQPELQVGFPFLQQGPDVFYVLVYVERKSAIVVPATDVQLWETRMTDYSELLDAGHVKRGRFARRQVEDCLAIARGDLEMAGIARRVGKQRS